MKAHTSIGSERQHRRIDTTPDPLTGLRPEPPPTTLRRLAVTAALVAIVLAGSFISLIAAAYFLLCGLDGNGACPAYGLPLGIVLLLVAIVLFMATSPIAGVRHRRWWAWMMPVWILVVLQTVFLIARIVGESGVADRMI